jgi:hypothetical protein
MFLIGFYFNIGTKAADCQQFQRGNITSDCLKGKTEWRRKTNIMRGMMLKRQLKQAQLQKPELLVTAELMFCRGFY